jgi:hypothetical protein
MLVASLAITAFSYHYDTFDVSGRSVLRLCPPPVALLRGALTPAEAGAGLVAGMQERARRPLAMAHHLRRLHLRQPLLEVPPPPTVALLHEPSGCKALPGKYTAGTSWRHHAVHWMGVPRQCRPFGWFAVFSSSDLRTRWPASTQNMWEREDGVQQAREAALADIERLETGEAFTLLRQSTGGAAAAATAAPTASAAAARPKVLATGSAGSSGSKQAAD